MGWMLPRLLLRIVTYRYRVATALFFLFLLILVYKRHFLQPRLPVQQRLAVIGYWCDVHDGLCGGWADRQKGIVTAYVLSAMLGAEFRVQMTKPCSLDFFLSPGSSIDWRLRPGELQDRHVQWIRKIDHDATAFTKELLSLEDPGEMFEGEYVFLTTNMEVVHLLRQHRLAQTIRWLQELSVAEVYRHVLTELFDLMAGPRVVLQGFTQSLPPAATLVCAQIRVGGGSDPGSFNTKEQLQGLISFLAPYNTSSHRLLFTSDSPDMLRRAQAAFPALSLHIRGPVSHVDLASGNDRCGGLGRAIVEQTALSTCDVLVISESGLALIAAFLRDSDHRLYLFHDGIVQPFRRADPFPNRLW